jgi:hypothetical protein
MSHLIQPILIDGTRYCVSYHGNRATRGVLTAFYASANTAELANGPGGTEDLAGPWVLIFGSSSTATVWEGEISFGVGCGSQITVQLSNAGEEGVAVFAYLNNAGAPIASETLEVETKNMVIDITDAPCGSIITLYAFNEDDGPTYSTLCTAEIVSIT